MPVATGNFEVKLTPLDGAVGRMAIDKTFHGAIEAVSAGEMLAVNDPDAGFAAYVALEQVSGVVEGRAGSFWLQHKATMVNGEGQLEVAVVPGSGSGELAGLAGSMTIDAANNYAYTFDYLLPA